MVYPAVVISILLHACEIWLLCWRDNLKLERFHQKETSSNSVEHVAGPDQEKWSSPPCKDGEYRNYHDSTSSWPNTRNPLTQTNPLLRACIWQETMCGPTSLIQGSARKHLTEDRNQSSQLRYGSFRKNQLKNNQQKKKTFKIRREPKEKPKLTTT